MTQLFFKDATDFVRALTKRVDKSPYVIVSIGVSSPKGCDGAVFSSIGGNCICGAFYDCVTDTFYDGFIISISYWNVESAERVIGRIREVADVFYH
ncbi:MAG: hypothetical protein IJP99_10605 [Methanobrevibacter sp.]|nr:hypothetical protein [Methanobrevibacter sp.]MBR0059768.1 hypothetical protein [Methanobrevibacter sp.]